jgi:hypothetical protein
MKSREHKPIQKGDRAALPEETVSEIRGELKDAKLNLRAAPPIPPTPKKIHPRRPLPTVPDDPSGP